MWTRIKISNLIEFEGKKYLAKYHVLPPDPLGLPCDFAKAN